MGHTARQLADGFKLLRLPQLQLHGAQLRDIFGDDLESAGLIGKRKRAGVEAYCHNSSIPPPPLGFGTLHFSLFAAGGHDGGVLFGEAKYVAHCVGLDRRAKWQFWLIRIRG